MEECANCPHPKKDHYVRKESSSTGCMWCVCKEFEKKSRAEIAADKKEAKEEAEAAAEEAAATEV